MPGLTEKASKAWDDRNGPVVFTTVDEHGLPNSIYAICVKKYDDKTLVIADNYFDKTRKNIQQGSKGSILFITGEGVAFQAKGSIEYHSQGPIFEDMKQWNPKKHPGHAAAVLLVEEVYSGSQKLS